MCFRNTNRVSDGTKPHSQDEETYHLSIVEEVNSQIGITWKARYNKFASRAEATTGTGTSDTDTARLILKKFFNLDDSQLLQDTVTHIEDLWKVKKPIPKSFDVRTAWPKCWAVHQIFNQAGCGSCWSVAATSVMSDRVCIKSNGTLQTQISALDLTSCCLSCGGLEAFAHELLRIPIPYVFLGVKGHIGLYQLSHIGRNTGLFQHLNKAYVGGAFGTHEGCRPYTFEPSCGTPCGPSLYRKERTPRCERHCQSLYHKTYEQDLVQGKSEGFRIIQKKTIPFYAFYKKRVQARKAYWLRAINGSSEYTPIVKTTLQKLIDGKITEILQRELMTYGPVLACFTLYEDFQHYMSGIYKTDETRSLQLYGHCAKLLGWGEQGGVKYWLYANTWGRDWGENGFFRVDMNEIPEEVVAGVL
ncbi:unnamed protein product [Strongylus vulgaris]|uniref:Peptidase C1A papain C-terminal domain-containing protein n=1 Tax=Strongylus vulgaris TaxID=40348 RepID=A0A3P7L5A7_STRVU|nr:unnamed protein product [Strongylus vulgaris]